MAALLLGLSTARRLYADRPAPQLSYLLSLTPPFLLKLRVALKCAIERLGAETVTEQLQLPREITAKLGTPDSLQADLTDCCSIETPLERPIPTVILTEDKSLPVLPITEEDKKAAVSLYNRGIKLQYIAGLFGLTNPKVINSWGDWKKRPKHEADNNLERRQKILDRLQAGEDPKTIRADMHLKERVYRELLGTPIQPGFTYEQYQEAMSLANGDKSMKKVCKMLGIPSYFVRRWMNGKGIPPKPLLEEDREGSVDTKKRAILKFYESGNSTLAAKVAGVSQQNVVERWVMKYQQAVDEQGRSEAAENSKDTA